MAAVAAAEDRELGEWRKPGRIGGEEAMVAARTKRVVLYSRAGARSFAVAWRRVGANREESYLLQISSLQIAV